ncbi:MAG: SPOR domain-containing protein [Pseudomonadota bacterium]
MARNPAFGAYRWRNAAVCGTVMLFLAGCTEDGQFEVPQLFKPNEAADASTETVTAAETAVKLVERDVEAPEVFETNDSGLWDGRPSLGGVWVAHPDVREPERVIIRNTENSQFVIGALFRRERDTPGPILQVSSDAAVELGMLAGAPATLEVIALRREAAPDPDALAAAEIEPLDGEAAEALDAERIETSALDPIAGAAAAIDAAEAEKLEAKPAVATEPAPKPQATAVKAPASSLSKPFLQIGIFSVQQNAENTAVAMRQAGMVPTVKEHSSKGKTFWRVVVGPAQSKDERSVLLKKIKGVGFEDAYPVTH